MSSESDGKVTHTGEGAPPVISRVDMWVGKESDPGDKDMPPTNQQSVSQPRTLL